MLETHVGDGPEELWLEEEVTEAGRVNADVGALLVLGLGSGCGAVLGGGGGGSGCRRRDRVEGIVLVVCTRPDRAESVP